MPINAIASHFRAKFSALQERFEIVETRQHSNNEHNQPLRLSFQTRLSTQARSDNRTTNLAENCLYANTWLTPRWKLRYCGASLHVLVNVQTWYVACLGHSPENLHELRCKIDGASLVAVSR